MKHRLAIILLFLLCSSFLAICQNTAVIGTPEQNAKIQDCVKQFFNGSGSDEVFAYISSGTFQELAPPAKVIRQTYKGSELVFLKTLVWSNTTAVVFLKTKVKNMPDQYHSLQLHEIDNKQWKVWAWHTSQK